MPPKNSGAVKLKHRGRTRLRKALLGDVGYGFPARQRGYRLVGQAHGRLEPLFDRNDHHKLPMFIGFPDADDFAWSKMSREFWDRFMVRLDENKDAQWLWINTWRPTPTLQIEVYCEVVTGERLHIPVWRKDQPWRMFMCSFTLRMRVTSTKAENQARKKLNTALNGRQRRELLLNGEFVVEGKSGVKYRIRANRPTIAYREEMLPNRRRDVRFLAAMCLHPLGYYEDTFTGCMPPSDEMLAHLKMIRADEHFFWRKCGQHGAEDPRSGL